MYKATVKSNLKVVVETALRLMSVFSFLSIIIHYDHFHGEVLCQSHTVIAHIHIYYIYIYLLQLNVGPLERFQIFINVSIL